MTWYSFENTSYRETDMKRHAGLCVLVAAAALSSLDAPARAADRVVLTPQTWDEFVPQGKEVDAIYGDVVLRNDKIVAVIASPVAGRNANMTVTNVGGCVIDLTLRAEMNDQLGAFYPLGKTMNWRADAKIEDVREQPEVRISFQSKATPARPGAEVTYTLKDGSPALVVETKLINSSDTSVKFSVVDEVRADASFTKVPNGKTRSFWVYDSWWGQAYGLVTLDGNSPPMDVVSDARLSKIRYGGKGDELLVEPGASRAVGTLTRHLFPARHPLELFKTEASLRGVTLPESVIRVVDASGKSVAGAELVVKRKGGEKLAGRTDADGRIASIAGSEDELSGEIVTLGSGTHPVTLKSGDQTVTVPTAGRVVAKITGDDGGPIPCKVQFRRSDGEKDPVLGPPSGEHAVGNLYYSHDGAFEQVLPPGNYEAIVSHGPEYDAVFTPIEIKQGEATQLTTALKHSVSAPGWISADFHSHSSPSGDNVASQLGRVLNLLCEGVEYAPCTEHNRISSYDPHLEKLGVKHLMGTCTGIELTGSPLPINHQNAFPMVMKPRTQNNGGPTNDVNPSVQIERLAYWDDKSDKLVQQNHPDIGKLFFDKDADGQPDKGFEKSIPYIDVMEVHPLNTIFDPPPTARRLRYNNTVFNWLQLLNQGYRIPGTVNTDAHYNFHGSGFLRTYFRSPETDDPTKVKVLDVVHAAERGHLVMTSGPYLEVSALAALSEGRAYMPGEDIKAPGGRVTLKVRVQCPNWFDIDRVQVLVSGKPEPKLNFTRADNADAFNDGVVKFDREIRVELAGDAHLIVVAAGEKLRLGRVMGPDHEKDMPIAVSNPIYVDVDGDGKFTPNRDTLGAPLPLAELPAPTTTTAPAAK